MLFCRTARLHVNLRVRVFMAFSAPPVRVPATDFGKGFANHTAVFASRKGISATLPVSLCCELVPS